MRDSLCLGLLIFGWFATATAEEAAHHQGRVIYERLCVECHGETGEGNSDNAVDALYGNRSVTSLAKRIERTMPEDDEDLCVGEDAELVAAYIYDAFYSEEAQARIAPPKRDLTRLTVPQFYNSVADVVEKFVWKGGARAPETRGLKMRVKGIHADSEDSNKFSGVKHSTEGVLEKLTFDLREQVKDEPFNQKSEISAKIEGSLVIDESGEYEFAVDSGNGFRLWVNETDKEMPPLVDGWVVSGKEIRREKSSIRLLGGRTYPLRLHLVVSQNEDLSSIEVLWKKPGGIFQPIPAEALTPEWRPPSMVVRTTFPPDDASYGYERGSSISRTWIEAVTQSSVETADFVVRHLERMANLKDEDDQETRLAKLSEFAEQFVAAAFRRPLSESEKRLVEGRLSGPDGTEEGLKRTIIYAITSPIFLYPDLPQNDSPDSYQVASRLALVLWDSVPDDRLRDLASKGKLLSQDVVREEATRMLDSPKAKAKTRGFFHQWLELDRTGHLAKDAEKFPEFTAEVVSDLKTSLELFLDDVIWSERSDYRELLLADYLYLNSTLAPLYGEQVDGDHFQKISIDKELRSGVVTHPYLLAMLAYHNNTSPIHRGVFLTRNIVGRSLKPPPDAIEFADSDFDPALTMREKVADMTKATSCMACHSTINPLGFSLENFDAIGRFRTMDKNKPINARSGFTGDEGEAFELKGARDVANFAVGSENAQRGFVRQLFNFTVKQSSGSYGSGTDNRLFKSFVEQQFNIQKLLVEIASTAALEGTQSDPGAKSTASK